jgi:hypothetical protein
MIEAMRCEMASGRVRAFGVRNCCDLGSFLAKSANDSRTAEIPYVVVVGCFLLLGLDCLGGFDFFSRRSFPNSETR